MGRTAGFGFLSVKFGTYCRFWFSECEIEQIKKRTRFWSYECEIKKLVSGFKGYYCPGFVVCSSIDRILCSFKEGIAYRYIKYTVFMYIVYLNMLVLNTVRFNKHAT